MNIDLFEYGEQRERQITAQHTYEEICRLREAMGRINNRAAAQDMIDTFNGSTELPFERWLHWEVNCKWYPHNTHEYKMRCLSWRDDSLFNLRLMTEQLQAHWGRNSSILITSSRFGAVDYSPYLAYLTEKR